MPHRGRDAVPRVRKARSPTRPTPREGRVPPRPRGQHGSRPSQRRPAPSPIDHPRTLHFPHKQRRKTKGKLLTEITRIETFQAFLRGIQDVCTSIPRRLRLPSHRVLAFVYFGDHGLGFLQVYAARTFYAWQAGCRACNGAGAKSSHERTQSSPIHEKPDRASRAGLYGANETGTPFGVPFCEQIAPAWSAWGRFWP